MFWLRNKKTIFSIHTLNLSPVSVPNSLDPDVLSVLIRVQTSCESYQQMTKVELVGRLSSLVNLTLCLFIYKRIEKQF